MASYGGGYKGGYGGGGSGGGGGDDAGGFVFGSQQGSQGNNQKSRENDTLRPVTIKQILDAEETYSESGEFRIDGAHIAQVTFVGQIRYVNAFQTNIQFKIDDGTGVLECKKFVDPEKPKDGPEFKVLEHDYVRAYGRLKSFNNNRNVILHFIRPVSDNNEIHYHLLEAAAVHLYFAKGPVGGQGAGTVNAGGGDSMFVDDNGYGGGVGAGAGGNAGGGVGGNMNQHAGGAAKLGNVSSEAQRLYNFMLNTPGGNEGLHLQVLGKSSGMTTREVLKAADELLGQGVIYTTVDDETWAVLEY